MRRIPLLPLLALLAACSAEEGRTEPAAEARSPAPPAAEAETPETAPAWRVRPAEGVRLLPGDPLVVETGPHVVLWPEDAAVLEPPYAVRATLRKESGRLHEGMGIVFGGDPLDAPETEQRYAYFLVRGDGSYLVKERIGAELRVLRGWTAHPAIRRDDERGGRANELEVRAGADDVAFLVNGEEVARVPAAELPLRGRAGLRVAHDVRLAVESFEAGSGDADPPRAE